MYLATLFNFPVVWTVIIRMIHFRPFLAASPAPFVATLARHVKACTVLFDPNLAPWALHRVHLEP